MHSVKRGKMCDYGATETSWLQTYRKLLCCIYYNKNSFLKTNEMHYKKWIDKKRSTLKCLKHRILRVEPSKTNVVRRVISINATLTVLLTKSPTSYDPTGQKSCLNWHVFICKHSHMLIIIIINLKFPLSLEQQQHRHLVAPGSGVVSPLSAIAVS